MIGKLERDDPDFIQLDREIKHLEERYKTYVRSEERKAHEKAISNCDPEFCNQSKKQNKD